MKISTEEIDKAHLILRQIKTGVEGGLRQPTLAKKEFGRERKRNFTFLRKKMMQLLNLLKINSFMNGGSGDSWVKILKMPTL